ncbi:unnamed protein product, partial [Musa acuminata subsp. burmannicoides]
MTEGATVTTPPSTLSLVARFRFRESETSDMQDSPNSSIPLAHSCTCQRCRLKVPTTQKRLWKRV